MPPRTALIVHLLRRLLYLPLTLLLLSIVVFGMSRIAPDDAVERRMSVGGNRAVTTEPATYAREYRRQAAREGHDLPVFYLTMSSRALPDTFYRVVIPERRRALRALAFRYGNWPLVQAYYDRVRALANAPPDRVPASIVTAARRLLREGEREDISRELSVIRAASDPPATDLVRAYDALRSSETYAAPLPRLRWHGTANQYHRFLSRLLRGDLGTSLVDRRPVARKIVTALPTTLLLNVLALLLVYLMGVPLGLYQARYAGTAFDRWTTAVTFVAFGVPSFWVATMAVNYLTSPSYDLSVGRLFWPVLCLAYPSWAYVSRHLRAAALEELLQPYVMTARMKGLSEHRVLWRHVFRNAAFPLITMLGGLLPALLAGSVVIERIFNLPGMGQLLFDAALGRDWPVLSALVMINGLLTIIGLLVADLGYALLDPRVSLAKNSSR